MNIILALFTICGIYATQSATSPTPKPTNRPTSRPTSETQTVNLYYNFSDIENGTFVEIGDVIDFKSWLKTNVKAAILETSTISSADVQVLAVEVLGYGTILVRADMDLDVRWNQIDAILVNQKGTTFTEMVERYFEAEFGDTSVVFVVDIDSINVDAANIFSMIGLVVTIFIAVLGTF